MKENLYTFSKNAWHVRLFKWIYNTDPTQTFNTMCPYFWSLVATILLLPLILVIKLFGKGGTSLLSRLESYKRDKQDKTICTFKEKCEKEDLTDEEAYYIKKSKCWSNYYYYLDGDVYDKVYNKAYIYYNDVISVINKEKELKAVQRKQKIEEVKESKIFIFISYVVSFLVFSFALYLSYKGILMIEFRPIDWILVGQVSLYIVEIIGAILLIVGVSRFIIFPIFDWLRCKKCVLCQYPIGKYLIAPFKFIWKGILIVGDMIYMTYKQACPIITWKDSNTNR